MTVRVRPLAVHDDAEVRLVQSLYEETERSVDPDASLYSLAEFRQVITSQSQEWLHAACVAEQDGQVLGSSLLQTRLVSGTRSAFARIWVAPRNARRGAGSTLATHAEDWARAQGRTVLTSEVDIHGRGSSQAMAFAERRGYTVALVEEERRLALPRPAAHWRGLAAEAAAHHQGYEVVTVTGPIPADLAAGYCAVYNRLPLESPQGELEVTGPTRRTPADLALQDEEIVASGAVRYTGLALRDGQVVGFCSVAAQPGVRHLSQWTTIVAADHRGRRLGLAVKTAAYAAATAAHPEREYVSTWNAASNEPMIRVNERMGFALHSATATVQKRLG